MMSALGRYLFNILVAIDQFVNTILGGDPDETISSRLGKIMAKRKHRCVVCRWVCWFLDKIDPNHCANSIEEDEGKNAVR